MKDTELLMYEKDTELLMYEVDKLEKQKRLLIEQIDVLKEDNVHLRLLIKELSGLNGNTPALEQAIATANALIGHNKVGKEIHVVD